MKRIVLVLSVSTLWFAQDALADLYRFSGEVVRVTPHSIRVRSGASQIEFERSPSLKLPREVHDGDYITVEYEARATRVEVTPRAKGQQPGQKPSTPGLVPQPLPSVFPGIIDDRNFYGA